MNHSRWPIAGFQWAVGVLGVRAAVFGELAPAFISGIFLLGSIALQEYYRRQRSKTNTHHQHKRKDDK
jgi:hypothetical protein